MECCRRDVEGCRRLTQGGGGTVDAMEDLVLLERRSDGVAVVTLNNPKVNALSQAVLARLR